MDSKGIDNLREIFQQFGWNYSIYQEQSASNFDRISVLNVYAHSRSPKFGGLHVSNWMRFGNSVMQISNLAKLCSKYSIPTVYFETEHEFFDVAKLSRNLSVPFVRRSKLQFVPDDGCILSGGFFFDNAFHLFERRDDRQAIMDRHVVPLLPAEFTRGHPLVGPSTLTVHFRAGDIFSDLIHPGMGQPPLSYYLMALEKTAPDRVIVVSEDMGNPNVGPFIEKARASGRDVHFQSQDLRSDLAVLFNSPNLVIGTGSFLWSVHALSRRLRDIWIFDRAFDTSPLTRRHIRVNYVTDRPGDYVRQVMSNNWRNTEEQRQIMVDYGLTNLKLDTWNVGTHASDVGEKPAGEGAADFSAEYRSRRESLVAVNMTDNLYGEGIWHTDRADGPTCSLAWTFDANDAAEMHLWVLYAADGLRPCAIIVNDETVSNQAVAATTGGWTNAFLRWRHQCTVSVRSGRNTICVERKGAMPHIAAFALTASLPEGFIVGEEHHQSLDLIRDLLGGQVRGVVQVGANVGDETKAFVTHGIHHGILVEPLADCVAHINRKIAQHTGYTVVQAVASERTGDTVKFNVASNSGASSSLLAPTGHLEAFPGVEFGSVIELKTQSLDDIVSSAARKLAQDPKLFNFLFMDVQGAELSVLRGAAETLAHIDYIWTEVSLREFYDGGAQLHEIVDFLAGHGFNLHWTSIARFGMGDALFARGERKAALGGAAAARARVHRAANPGKPFVSLVDAHLASSGAGDVVRWVLSNVPIPPPEAVKHFTILDCLERYQLSTVIETGTLVGNTSYTLGSYGITVHTIELADKLYERAVERFRGMPNVHCHHGDSTTVLPGLLKSLSAPAVFWLDGHYSMGETAKGELETPIIAELEALSLVRTSKHVILIDDARCFGTLPDYPTLPELEKICAKLFPEYKFSVFHDIIRLEP